MIDFESLLEFEESLGQSLNRSHKLILLALEAKIDQVREDDRNFHDDVDPALSCCSEAQPSVEELAESYDVREDEFARCNTCGQSLARAADAEAEAEAPAPASCCKMAMDKNKLASWSSLDKSYWASFMDNPSRTINTLPNYTELSCLRQGIPNCLRSFVWRKLFLLNSTKIPTSIQLVYQNFQHSYSVEVATQIKKDLSRTFPAVEFFKEARTIEDLSTILNVYANYDAELGYCQGLLFLVGVLYHHLQRNCELTFYALTNIMAIESELHDVFTPTMMSTISNQWANEFASIFKQVDTEFYTHLSSIADMSTFLFQWWLSFMSSHVPDLSIISRIMDFCLLQGWKVGIFKISLGLLVSNRPILMSLVEGDEEVVYQHMLNESKWGTVMGNLEGFFGELLFSWQDDLFIDFQRIESMSSSTSTSDTYPYASHAHPYTLQSLKSLPLFNLKSPTAPGRLRSNTTSTGATNQSQSSLFSFKTSSNGKYAESIYSNTSEDSLETKSFTDFLKLPTFAKKNHNSNEKSSGKMEDDLWAENKSLRLENDELKMMLGKAFALLNAPAGENEMEIALLKGEILQVISEE
ncbi:uncharacterized protein LODBEIA_P40490 [Lodderomyces beijingensis]|uniref:Oxidant-induced cell-cycle arrest protein 5 n=1 Tax=Lodderomyces beijingensis TaxID=1775926 RepID=A0ABP0ZUH9_9ASCO